MGAVTLVEHTGYPTELPVQFRKVFDVLAMKDYVVIELVPSRKRSSAWSWDVLERVEIKSCNDESKDPYYSNYAAANCTGL